MGSQTSHLSYPENKQDLCALCASVANSQWLYGRSRTKTLASVITPPSCVMEIGPVTIGVTSIGVVESARPLSSTSTCPPRFETRVRFQPMPSD